jgi:hypothetical protein
VRVTGSKVSGTTIVVLNFAVYEMPSEQKGLLIRVAAVSIL